MKDMKDMNRIDKLLNKAHELACAAMEMFFPPDEDGFVEALGAHKEQYAVELPNGSTGYDFLQALNDAAAEDWESEKNIDGRVENVNKIDKLLNAAKTISADPGVHIMTEGYCTTCKGECQALENPEAVIIVNDVPKDTNFEALKKEMEQQHTQSRTQADTPPNCGNVTGFSSLTQEEREYVLSQYGADVLLNEEKSQKKKYKNMFGYG